MLTRVGASKSYVFFVEIIIKGAVDRVDAVSRARTGSLLPRSNSQRSIRMKFELAINHMGKPERHARCCWTSFLDGCRFSYNRCPRVLSFDCYAIGLWIIRKASL